MNSIYFFSEKFRPAKWVTDMARSNFNGLKRVYGDDVVEDIMGCEFHFRQSVSERKRKIGNEDDAEMFQRFAEDMLTASSEAAYMAAYMKMKEFVETKYEDIGPWLTWWHACRSNMFRAFTGQNKPYANQAEVCHASWVNRGEVGLSLRESAEFDTSDALLLKDKLKKFHQTKAVCPGYLFLHIYSSLFFIYNAYILLT